MSLISLLSRARLARAAAVSLVASLTLSSASAATHLFVPGHGITARTSGQTKTVNDLIAECQSTGSWMRIVEMPYEWADLEGATAGSWNAAGMAQIRQDAEACAAAGKYLRVMLLHKFGTYPTYMTTGNAHTMLMENGIDRNITLNKSETLARLKALYARVITELKSTSQAKAGFYGFVLQETALGGGAYFDDPIVKAAWFNNLRAFHVWLSQNGRLKDFSTVAPGGRLFWQMINANISEVNSIVAQMPAGGGLCGPDTFPREPVSTENALYAAYNHMRNNSVLPVSVHVYHKNYSTDRAPHHGEAEILNGVQPIWANTNKNALRLPGNYDNLNAGDGIANFLGCVSNVNNGGKPDNLNVHNIIWSTAQGTTNTEGENPAGAYGWPQVKAWMQITSGEFPNGGNWGGCNGIVPTSID